MDRAAEKTQELLDRAEKVSQALKEEKKNLDELQKKLEAESRKLSEIKETINQL